MKKLRNMKVMLILIEIAELITGKGTWTIGKKEHELRTLKQLHC